MNTTQAYLVIVGHITYQSVDVMGTHIPPNVYLNALACKYTISNIDHAARIIRAETPSARRTRSVSKIGKFVYRLCINRAGNINAVSEIFQPNVYAIFNEIFLYFARFQSIHQQAVATLINPSVVQKVIHIGQFVI